MTDQGTSRAALLDIREERDQFRQGHQFLDEKRMLLAQEILHRLDRYQALSASLAENLLEARGLYRKVLELHGLENVQLAPAATARCSDPPLKEASFLGVPMRSAPPRVEFAGAVPIPSLAALAKAFTTLLTQQVERAAEEVNLRRLLADYRRTERRVRALEDVLLPELNRAGAALSEQLEEGEREEAVGIRWFASGDR